MQRRGIDPLSLRTRVVIELWRINSLISLIHEDQSTSYFTILLIGSQQTLLKKKRWKNPKIMDRWRLFTRLVIVKWNGYKYTMRIRMLLIRSDSGSFELHHFLTLAARLQEKRERVQSTISTDYDLRLHADFYHRREKKHICMCNVNIALRESVSRTYNIYLRAWKRNLRAEDTPYSYFWPSPWFFDRDIYSGYII